MLCEILDANQFTKFWINLRNGRLSVGKGQVVGQGEFLAVGEVLHEPLYPLIHLVNVSRMRTTIKRASSCVGIQPRTTVWSRRRTGVEDLSRTRGHSRTRCSEGPAWQPECIPTSVSETCAAQFEEYCGNEISGISDAIDCLKASPSGCIFHLSW